MNEVYPFIGPGTAVHATVIDSPKTLCGITPPRYWEMAYRGEAFPEIKGFTANDLASKREGFYIGRAFATDVDFCKRCYKALKKIKGIT